jgi:hypothetical protein
MPLILRKERRGIKEIPKKREAEGTMPVPCVISGFPHKADGTGNFCPITQRVAVVSYRRFNKTHRSSPEDGTYGLC